MNDEVKNAADIELPREIPIAEAKPQVLPICPLCGVDPMIPIARKINIPFERGGPPIAFLIIFCQTCRKPLPAADFVCLGIPQGPQSPIALPTGFRQ